MQLLKMSTMNTFSHVRNTSEIMWREKVKIIELQWIEKYANKYDKKQIPSKANNNDLKLKVL